MPATLPSGFLGNVRLVLLLNELGVIDRIVVEDSALSAELTKAVVEPFKAVRFTPGEIDGIPVKCAYTVLVDLQPKTSAGSIGPKRRTHPRSRNG